MRCIIQQLNWSCFGHSHADAADPAGAVVAAADVMLFQSLLIHLVRKALTLRMRPLVLLPMLQ